MVARAVTTMRGAFHGWRLVSGAMGLQMLLAALFFQAYGAYAPFWIAEFGWSRTTVSLAFSLHRTESGLLGPIHGWLLQRVSPRRIIFAGVVILGSGFVALSQVQSFIQFLLVFLFMAIGASFCGILSLMTVIVNWFDRRRATALSMMHLGFSIGGLAIPLVALGLVGMGWRTMAVVSGLLVLAAGIPISRLMIREPEMMGLRPDGDGEQPAPSPGAVPPAAATNATMTVRRALTTRAFWMLSAGHAAAITVASSIMVHFVIYAHETVGLSVTLAANLVAVMTFMALVGQVIGGVAGDRFEKRVLAGAAMLGHGTAMAILASAANVWMVALAVGLHGLSVGVRGPLMGALKADFFGRRIFAAVSGFGSLVVMVGSIAGPVLVGLVADVSGDYAPAFWGLAALAAAGSVAFFGLKRPADRAH